MIPSFQVSFQQNLDDETLQELHEQLQESDHSYDESLETFKEKLQIKAIEMSCTYEYDVETGDVILTDEVCGAW